MSITLEFDGIDNYVRIPFFQNPGSAFDWSFCLAFKATAQPTPGDGSSLNGGIMGQAGSTQQVRWLQHFTSGPNNTLRVPICNPASPLAVGDFDLDKWYLVFLRRTGSPSSLRADLLRTGTANPGITFNGTVQQANLEHYLGFNGELFNEGFKGWWPGHMGFMAHWDRRITDTEMFKMHEGVRDYKGLEGL